MSLSSLSPLSKNPRSIPAIDGRPLSRVSSFKCLGLYIDENLTWCEHTTSVNSYCITCTVFVIGNNFCKDQALQAPYLYT